MKRRFEEVEEHETAEEQVIVAENSSEDTDEMENDEGDY